MLEVDMKVVINAIEQIAYKTPFENSIFEIEKQKIFKFGHCAKRKIQRSSEVMGNAPAKFQNFRSRTPLGISL